MVYTGSDSCHQEQSTCESEKNCMMDDMISLGEIMDSDEEEEQPNESNAKCIDLTKAKNREQAKNIRIRQKNFIETLKDQIICMSQAHDSREKEKKIALSTLADKVCILYCFDCIVFNFNNNIIIFYVKS